MNPRLFTTFSRSKMIPFTLTFSDITNEQDLIAVHRVLTEAPVVIAIRAWSRVRDNAQFMVELKTPSCALVLKQHLIKHGATPASLR